MRDKVTGRPRGFGLVVVVADLSLLDRVVQDKHSIDGRTQWVWSSKQWCWLWWLWAWGLWKCCGWVWGPAGGGYGNPKTSSSWLCEWPSRRSEEPLEQSISNWLWFCWLRWKYSLWSCFHMEIQLMVVRVAMGLLGDVVVVIQLTTLVVVQEKGVGSGFMGGGYGDSNGISGCPNAWRSDPLQGLSYGASQVSGPSGGSAGYGGAQGRRAQMR